MPFDPGRKIRRVLDPKTPRKSGMHQDPEDIARGIADGLRRTAGRMKESAELLESRADRLDALAIVIQTPDPKKRPLSTPKCPP